LRIKISLKQADVENKLNESHLNGMMWSQCFSVIQKPYSTPISTDSKSQNKLNESHLNDMMWSKCFSVIQKPYSTPLSTDSKSQNQIYYITHKPVAY